MNILGTVAAVTGRRWGQERLAAKGKLGQAAALRAEAQKAAPELNFVFNDRFVCFFLSPGGFAYSFH